MRRAVAILEPLAMFALIMLYIWRLRARYPDFWLAILGLMVLSHVLHRESTAALGFRLRNFRQCLRRYGSALALIALAILGSGRLLHTIRHIDAEGALLAGAAYLPWGLCQQYMLNGYFFRRFEGLVFGRAAPAVVAVLFSAAHFPNAFLMAAALAGGYCSTRVYRSSKNLYFLALAHAIVGFSLFLAAPDSLTHHLRVGPGWYTY